MLKPGGRDMIIDLKGDVPSPPKNHPWLRHTQLNDRMTCP